MKKTILKFLFAVIFAGSLQFVAAQAPTTPAPAPTHDAADVVSLFSGHYTTVGKGPEIQAWGGNAVTKVTIAGTNDEMLSSSGSSSAIYTSGWTAQTKGYVHMDVYSVTGGTFSFALGVSFSNVHTWLINYSWPTIPARQWTGIDVPVIEFVKAGLDDAVNVQGLRFSGTGGTYYVDNIYAYGPKEVYVEPASIPVAPTPTHDPDEVKSVFSDTYTASQKGINPQTFGGIVAKIMPYESSPQQEVLRLAGLGTSLSTIDTWNITDKGYIHLDVYYAGDGDGSFSFGMNANDWSGNNIKTPDATYTWPSTIEGQWVSMEIPVSLFTAAGLTTSKITQIKFLGSGDFFVDNLYAYSTPVPVLPIDPATTVPTVVADVANVKSIFCEQFEAEGYQDSELGMTDIDGNGNLMFYGQNANQEREFVEIVPGNKTIYLTSWNDYPFKVHKNSTTMDLSDMKYLHVSAYLASNLDVNNKSASLTFLMHDSNGGKLDNSSDVPSINMIPGEWVSISIPLCYYENKLDLSNTYVLRARLGGYGAMDVYIDNIFAYKGEPIEGSFVAIDCTPLPPPDDPIQDTTAGTLPPRDQAFLGVNLSSAAGGTNPGILGTNYRYPKFEDLYYFNAKGVKLIRLPFRWKRIQSEIGGDLVEKDITEMKRVIKEAERLGIWVMPDMHDYMEYSRNDTLYEVGVAGYRVWRPAANTWGPWTASQSAAISKEHYADVWVKLAQAFSDCSNIWGYDLMNEPKGIDINVLKDNYQAVIDAVRQVDTKAAIVIEGKSYASSANWPNVSNELKDLTDPIGNNIIYQAHTYFDNDASGTYNEDYDIEVKDFNIYKQRLDPFINWCKTNNKKGMIGEFGVPYNGAKFSDPRYMVLIDSVFSYLKQHQLTATYWCAGAFYEENHLTVQPAKDYFTEKSTMLIMDKYIRNFHVDNDPNDVKNIELGNNNIIIYPNPVINNLTVNSNIEISALRVYNMYGQMVYEQYANRSLKEDIDLTSLVKGNYLLKVEFKNGLSSVRKLVK